MPPWGWYLTIRPNRVTAVGSAQLPSVASELQVAREIVRSMLAKLGQLRQDRETDRGELSILRAAYDDQGARVARVIDQIGGEMTTV
jgi:hypothetical protein